MKKEANNFINLIINKIELAKNFHQRVALSITSKSILNHSTVLKFYIRRRYDNLYLYVRLDKCSFGNRERKHNFIRDLNLLFPQSKIEAIQGHYKGLVFHIVDENKQAIVDILKLIAVLAYPHFYYSKETKIYKSFYNYTHTSNIPIHLQLLNSKLDQLKNEDLINTLKGIKIYDKSNMGTYTTDM